MEQGVRRGLGKLEGWEQGGPALGLKAVCPHPACHYQFHILGTDNTKPNLVSSWRVQVIFLRASFNSLQAPIHPSTPHRSSLREPRTSDPRAHVPTPATS